MQVSPVRPHACLVFRDDGSARRSVKFEMNPLRMSLAHILACKCLDGTISAFTTIGHQPSHGASLALDILVFFFSFLFLFSFSFSFSFCSFYFIFLIILILFFDNFDSIINTAAVTFILTNWIF